jgi:RimJ/RimL family protein N-acetyltransferase
MPRLIKILKSQFKELSLSEFIGLLSRSLYYCDPILIYLREIINNNENNKKELDGFIIEKGEISDLDKMKEHLNPLPWEFQCHRFDNVKDFFIARNNEGIQHISWIYYHINHNRILSLGEKEAEVKFCLTLPAARGLGVYPMVINSIAQFLRHKGMNRIFMCVHEENQPSIRGIEKAGFHRVGKINVSKFLGFQVSKRFDTSEV